MKSIRGTGKGIYGGGIGVRFTTPVGMGAGSTSTRQGTPAYYLHIAEADANI